MLHITTVDVDVNGEHLVRFCIDSAFFDFRVLYKCIIIIIIIINVVTGCCCRTASQRCIWQRKRTTLM